jgi:hypothetical protein
LSAKNDGSFSAQPSTDHVPATTPLSASAFDSDDVVNVPRSTAATPPSAFVATSAPT